MDVDVVIFDGQLWAYRYTFDYVLFEALLQEIRILDHLSASRYIIPLHAIVVDRGQIHGFLTPFMCAGTLNNAF